LVISNIKEVQKSNISEVMSNKDIIVDYKVNEEILSNKDVKVS